MYLARWRAAARSRSSRLDSRHLPRDILGIIRDYTLPHIRDNMRVVPIDNPRGNFVIGMFRGELATYDHDDDYAVYHGDREIYRGESDACLSAYISDAIIWKTFGCVFRYDGTLQIIPHGAIDAVMYIGGQRMLPTFSVCIPGPCVHKDCRQRSFYQVYRGCSHDVKETISADYIGNYRGIDYYEDHEIHECTEVRILAAFHPDGSRRYLRTWKTLWYRPGNPILVNDYYSHCVILDPGDFSILGTCPRFDGIDSAQIDGGILYAVAYRSIYRLE